MLLQTLSLNVLPYRIVVLKIYRKTLNSRGNTFQLSFSNKEIPYLLLKIKLSAQLREQSLRQ